MLNNLTGWHAIVILVVVLLLFGATKLPALAKSVGQSLNIFKSEMKTNRPNDQADAQAVPNSTTPSAPHTSTSAPAPHSATEHNPKP